MLARALRGIAHGCYVDVGAAEPRVDSVTYAFYQQGWRGINVEPAPGAFQRLVSGRPGDINLNLAVGDRNGTMPFFLVAGGNGLSTAMPEQVHALTQDGWHIEEISVPVRTLSSIVGEYGDGPVHFLKVDAEGSEFAVLAGANLARFRPWIVIVEATAPNTQVPTHEGWERLVLEADYRFAWFDGLNRFYVSSEREDLLSSFRAQPNVFDCFIRYTEAEPHPTLRNAPPPRIYRRWPTENWFRLPSSSCEHLGA
jgi:FkbM family methyltransferase